MAPEDYRALLSAVRRLGLIARTLRSEIGQLLRQSHPPDAAAVLAGYREAIIRLLAIEQDAQEGGTARLPSLFRGLSVLLPSGSTTASEFAAAVREVTKLEARLREEEKD